ncbi:hypothetical protein ACFL6D_01300 [Spirochaetota bacterium]
MKKITAYIRSNYLNIFILIMISFSLSMEIYSIAVHKSFWLDEFFLIDNVKFSPPLELMGKLKYTQQFPRIYLLLIKWIGHAMKYSHYAFRLLPTSIQIVNILFVYYLFRCRFYDGNKNKILIAFLLFMTNFTTVMYFTQFKQYTMEVFAALVAIYQFFAIKKLLREGLCNKRYILISALFFIMPFFSYTYPICAVPLIGMLAFSFFYGSKDTSAVKMLIIPVIFFISSIVIVFFIDIKNVLADPIMNSYWRKYMVDYKNVNAFFSNLRFSTINLFTILFNTKRKYGNIFFDTAIILLKTSIGLIAAAGFIVNIIDAAKRIIKSRSLRPIGLSDSSIGIYFVLLFFLLYFCYFFIKLPLGPRRLNYFAVPMMIYFFIDGIHAFTDRYSIIKVLKKIYIYSLLVVLMGLFIKLYLNELNGLNTIFDQKAYDNYGLSIRSAYEKNAIIAILDEALPFHHTMFLKAHPAYKTYDQILVLHVMDISELYNEKNIADNRNIVVVKKYTYSIRSFRELCR